MLFSSRGYLNLLIMTLVLFFISRQTVLDLGFLSSFNHLYIAICTFAFILVVLLKPVNTKFVVIYIILLIYSFFLIFKNNIPYVNLLQTFITLKYVFVFFIMAYSFEYDRRELLKDYTNFLTVVLLVSVFFTLTDYMLPNFIFPLAKDGRGILGITPGSIFASRVLYSGFLLLYSTLLLSFKFNEVSGKYFIYHPRVYWALLFLSLILIFATFSRKELLLLFVVYGITTLYRNKGVIRLLLTVFLIAITPAIFAGLWLVIGDSVLENFNENYVRYKIFYYAMEIFEYNFPFGSGPGTYGTVMSKMYTDVYTFFDVDKAIIGYGNQIEGPIFDLFFVSLIAEYGLGIIFVMWFIFQPFFSEKDSFVDEVVHVRLLRVNAFLMLVGIGSMVPIMGNMVGLMLFFLLGIVTSNNSFFVQNRKPINA